MARVIKRVFDGGQNVHIIIPECPGCGMPHTMPVSTIETRDTWGWNGSVDNPTLTPSILSIGNGDVKRCHSFLKDGKMQFLSDCEHELKGKTIDLPEVDLK